MNAIATFQTDTTLTDVRTLARRRTHAPDNGDTFAAATSQLSGTRSQFYGGSGRLPNAKQKDSRRQRSLTGGPGNRHLGQLDLWTEREISRHLYDNSELFEGIISTWACETIQCGFTLKPASGDDALDARTKEALFGMDGDGGWCSECDARDLQHFWELITLAEETELTDGDHAFFLDPDGNDGAGTIEIIEGDRILTPSGYQPPDEQHCMFNGVEVDRRGKPSRLFIADEAPSHAHCSIEHGDLYPVFDRRNPAAGGVLFCVTPKRATATRRQPWLSTAVRAHDEIEDAFVATRIALRNAACRATYTKIDNWQDYFEWLQTVDPNYTGLAPEDALEHSPNPGDHVYLNPGEDFGFSEPNHPGQSFEPFMKFNLRFLGLPLGMGLEDVVRLFDNNFSQSRLGLEGTRRRYKRRQRTIKRRKVMPILSFANARLQAIGRLPASENISRFAHRYPVWPYIEPLKDAKANREMRDMGAKSSRTISEEGGYDFDQEQSEIESEGPLASAAPVTPPTEDDNDAPEDDE